MTWRSELLQRLQEVRGNCKTRNQLTLSTFFIHGGSCGKQGFAEHSSHSRTGLRDCKQPGFFSWITVETKPGRRGPGRGSIGTAALQGGRPVVALLPADHLAYSLAHGAVQAGSPPAWLESDGLTGQERCMLAACRPGTTKRVYVMSLCGMARQPSGGRPSTTEGCGPRKGEDFARHRRPGVPDHWSDGEHGRHSGPPRACTR